ncbi:pyridine nucleotide-disulfide oxidoreductase [Lentilactobacillus parafarraginis]|jgi:NADPH-dependent 2,4-dienoyl-CoA reductase/sulfur reductase-like enzyme/rhodanese-related sulfurtransferase|uniref:Pyridine nucleotide-disulfide oxidoreductase family protein n=2 Tax=Lentilactobacillus parafarraginis TaxID=390842 RepID=A0A0R1YXX7_9LACO|nr:FAD-dependent oxidoreductase [Lentilactobacillus parafarraginis]KRM44523.1 pyridine nucleotide-disulfide oxidoreductase family protein [Lentilactobacillus parafarraginis DSM 18390 = JCM 14109]TLQ19640.1 pyridine nucleotide-disulfide oxidoreductase [Lentilactobacillus parafarraginis]
MSKKIVVIGGVAGGASVAARARRLDEDAKVVMFEKGPNVSFSNCALPYHLSGTIADAEDIVLMDPKQFKAQYNIDAIVNHEVVGINPIAKTVEVRNVLTDDVTAEDYDELFLSPGATPILPRSIKGIDHENVFTIRNVVDIKKIKSFLDDNQIKDVSVIGGGFIGIETAENMNKGGYHVTLVEGMPHILGTIDDDMAQIIQKTMIDHDVDVITNDTLTEITDDDITLASGKTVKSGAVIMAVGVKPDTELAKKTGIKLGVTGGIKVDQNYQTNLPHIYAVGDAIELTNRMTRKPAKLNLAFPAQLEARQAVDHVYGRQIRNRGIIGSQCIPVFEMNVASTGLTEKQCQDEKIDYRSVMVIPKDKVALMPNAKPLYFKLVFAYPTGEILGAQAVGESAVDKQVDVIAAMITNHQYVEDLESLELCYQPMFSTAKNAVNMAGLVATNILNDEYKQVNVSEVRSLVESGATIIDVREKFEYEAGHIKNAINIPMSEFRDRLDEIPTGRPVYVHCLSGQRSYNVVRALNNMGYTNIYNISGSFLGISEEEYYRDVTEKREPIMTEYRFDLL